MIETELHTVEDWVEPLIRRLRPVERKRLLLHLARGLRQRQSRRIGQQRDPDGAPYEKRKPRAGKRGPMFRRLRQTKHLKAVADPTAAQVGFGGRTARIARVHSEGLTDRVEPGGVSHKYPERRLLGWSDADRDWVLSETHQYLADRH